MQTSPSHGGRGSNQYQTKGASTGTQATRSQTAAAATAASTLDVPAGFTRQDMQRLSRAGIDPATAVDYTREGLSVDDTILAIELGLQPTDLREGASNRPAEPEAIQEERRLRRYNQYLDDIQAGLREGFEILNIHPADQETVAPPGYSYVTCEVRHPDNGQIITAQIRADHDQYGTSRASQEHLARRVLAGGATVESVANPSLLTRHPHPDFYEYAEARIVNDGQMGAWVMFEFERRHWHA